MMKHWVRLVGAVLILSPFVTGCWDRLEIEDRGTILGLAIDPAGTDVESATGNYAQGEGTGYKLTAQVAIPGRIPLGPGEGTSGSGSQRPVWVVSTTGKTMSDAMNAMQKELADKLFLGHLRVIIVNQSLAKSPGLQDVQDFLRRNAEIRRLAWLLLSTGDANEAMEAAPKLERVPTLYLVGTMDHAVEMGKLPNVFLGNFWSVLSSKGQEPILPIISVKGEDRIETEGLAIFKGTKMVGDLGPLESAAFMEIMDQRKAGYGAAIPVPGDEAHSIIIRGSDRKTKIKLRAVHHKLSVDIYSRMEANIEERTGNVAVDSVISQVSAETSKFLTQGQDKLIQKTQDLGADIFGIGELVRGEQPEYWLHDIKTREQWDTVYARLPIRTHVKVYIRRQGMSAH